MFEDSEIRRNKKINRVARSGAYSLGGGVGLWFMNTLYPYEQSAAKIASLLGYVGAVLITYGALVLATVLFKRDLAIPVNMLLVWLLLPIVLILIFSKFWTG